MATPEAPSRRQLHRRDLAPRVVDVDVVVIGAGKAGLTAAYHLRRAQVAAVGSRGWEDARASFVVLDAADGPGGAWRAAWPGLAVTAAHSVQALPGMPMAIPDGEASANIAVPAYFNEYERAYGLNVLRPVRVTAVRPDGDHLIIETQHRVLPSEKVTFRARGVINASGNWTRPFWPRYPGQEEFGGRQIHSHQYRHPRDFIDGTVVVVGSGSSAVHIVAELSHVTSTVWVTRQPPQITELDRSSTVLRAQERGWMVARPMFERIGRRGIWFGPQVPPGWVDGPPFVEADTIIWATGFRPELTHLAPLRLRLAERDLTTGPAVAGEPRLQLVGVATAQAISHDAQIAVQNLRETLGW